MHKQYSRKKNRNTGNIMRFVHFYTEVIPVCRLSGKISGFSYTESSRKTGVIQLYSAWRWGRTDRVSLNLLRSNEYALICDVGHRDGAVKDRLSELGFTPGASLKCLGRSALGGMGAYLIKGGVIALRDSDAAQIFIIKTDG